MSDTRAKLDEAKFFLEELEKNAKEMPQFKYYLSAFIGSSRSASWIMQSEYKEIEGWREWYNKKNVENDEAIFFKAINDIRVRTTKKEPLKTRLKAIFEIPREDITDQIKELFERNVGRKAEIRIEPALDDFKPGVEGEKVQFRIILKRHFIALPEFPDEDSIDVCKKYYASLDALVKECDDLFEGKKEPGTANNNSFIKLEWPSS